MKQKKKKKNTVSGFIVGSFLLASVFALVLAIVVFGKDGLQYMDAAFQVYAKSLIGAAFLIHLLAFIYLKTHHNDSMDEMLIAPVRERKVTVIIMMFGLVLPLLLICQLHNSLALCMSIQDQLLPPSMRPELWSLQLPMLGYTLAFAVFWMLVWGILCAFWLNHYNNGTLAAHHLVIFLLSVALAFCLASVATQYLWWKIYGIYNEASKVSFFTQFASMFLALLVLVVFAVLFYSKKDSSQ